MPRCVGGGCGAPAARTRRRRRAPWCSCVAVVMRGTGGRRAGGGRVGANGTRSGGSCVGTRAVYCAVPRAVGATRGPAPTRHRRRSFSSTSSGSATCAARGHGEMLLWAGNRSRWAVFFNLRALRRTKGAGRLASWFSKGPPPRRAGRRPPSPRRCCERRPQRRRCRVFAGRGVRFLAK